MSNTLAKTTDLLVEMVNIAWVQVELFLKKGNLGEQQMQTMNGSAIYVDALIMK